VLLPWIVPFLFGAAFGGAIAPALVLCVACTFSALKGLIIQSLQGLGEGGAGFVAVFISIGVFLAAVWPLGHPLGLVGVGIAMGLGNLAALGYLILQLQKRFNLRLYDLWGLSQGTAREVWSATAHWNPLILKTFP
jgi:O-antigen/teichoic acid export membrane protein